MKLGVRNNLTSNNSVKIKRPVAPSISGVGTGAIGSTFKVG